MYKEVIYESDTVEFELEAMDSKSVALHIEPKIFNKAAYKEWQEVIADLVTELQRRDFKFLVAPVWSTDRVTAKLAVRFGFMPTGYTADGNVEVFTWALQEQ